MRNREQPHYMHFYDMPTGCGHVDRAARIDPLCPIQHEEVGALDHK